MAKRAIGFRGGETDNPSLVVLRVDATSSTLRGERFLTFARKIERILSSKIKPGLTHFSYARACKCADLAHVQIWHTFDRRPTSDEPRSFNHRLDSERKSWPPSSGCRTQSLAVSPRIEVSEPQPQSLKLTRLKIPLFVCAHSQRSATASANFVPAGVRV